MNASFALSRRVQHQEKEISSLRKDLEDAEVNISMEVGKAAQLEGDCERLAASERRLSATLKEKAAECQSLQQEKAKAEEEALDARRSLAAVEKENAALKRKAKLLQEAAVKAKQSVDQRVTKQMEDFIKSPAFDVFTGKQKAAFITEFVQHCSDKVPELPAMLAAYKESKSLPAAWFADDAPPTAP